jgi:hypothetical protein
VELGRIGTFGAASCAVPQHGIELGFDDSEPVWCQSPWSAGDRWARYSPDVVDAVVAYLALDSGWADEVREICEEAVDGCAYFTLGMCVLGVLVGTGNEVIPSSNRLLRQSTQRPKWDMKSTPMMGCLTSATTNRHLKSRL